MKPRTIIVGQSEAGQTVAALLHGHFHLSWPEIRRLLKDRLVRLGGVPCLNPKHRVRKGQRLEMHKPGSAGKPAPAKLKTSKQTAPAKEERFASPKNLKIVFSDAHIVVVDKPAGLTTVRHAHEAAEFGARGKRFLPATLADLLPALLAKKGSSTKERIRAVHRLDKETSGLVVLARTAAAERHLGLQFRGHTIERRYVALVRGRPRNQRIESFLVRDRGDGRRGSAVTTGDGQRAVTHVKLGEELGDFSLVECRLETGRTHQVRIHLGEQGTPLCGERVYDRPLHGQPLPDRSGAGRPALHAAFLAFDHPATGKRMMWTSALPKDMVDLVKRMQRMSK